LDTDWVLATCDQAFEVNFALIVEGGGFFSGFLHEGDKFIAGYQSISRQIISFKDVPGAKHWRYNVIEVLL
jgi:hypothetical protein